jgi:hypothetical protein
MARTQVAERALQFRTFASYAQHHARVKTKALSSIEQNGRVCLRTARLNTILVFIYRGLAIFELNAIITVDDPTSCELQRLSFEEFRGSTGEHIRSLSPMWSLSWNEGFSPCMRDREQKRDKQQSATAGPMLGLFCVRKHKDVAGMVGSKSHRASPAIPQYCKGAKS